MNWVNSDFVWLLIQTRLPIPSDQKTVLR